MYSMSATIYDAVYQSVGKDYRREARDIASLIDARATSGGRKLLDVACGTGEHLRHLAEQFDVEGLDLEPAMIECCRRKLPGTTLHVGNMIDFSLPARFDAIVCLFSSIGYAASIDELNRTIQNLAAHLKPGGVMIIEPWFGPGDLEDGYLHALLVEQPDQKICRMSVTRIDGRISRFEFNFLVATPEGGVRHFTEPHALTLFRREEYEAAFRSAGLEAEFDEKGIADRGLYLAVSPATG